MQKVVLLLLLCAALARAGHRETKAQVLQETLALRNAAHKSALESENDANKLNDEIFPSEPSAHEWHQESGAQMLAKWSSESASTEGRDPMATVRAAVPRKHASAVSHKNGALRAHTVARKQMVHAVAHRHKSTAAEQADAEEKAHAALINAAFPHHNAPKWHTESSGEMLAHMKAESEASLPHDEMAKVPMQTAQQMVEARRKEVDAAFPKRWAAQEKKVQVVGKVDDRKQAIKKHQQHVIAKVWGAKVGRKMDLKHNLLRSEQKTAQERAMAKQAGSAELHHLSKLDDEIWGHDSVEHKPLKPIQKHMLHKKMMAAHTQNAHDKEAPVYGHEVGRTLHTYYNKIHQRQVAQGIKGQEEKHNSQSSTQMPQSSDEEVSPMGTNSAFLGAPQGGYARKAQHRNGAMASTTR